MSRRTVGVLLIVTLTLVLASACTKLNAPANRAAQASPEMFAQPNAIPAAWGNLVAVSSVSQYPELVQMWFQDPQGEVRVIAFRVSTGEILNGKLIRRS